MTQTVLVPALGESISEAIVARWVVAVGGEVAPDAVLVELETDKVTVEVRAPVAGVLVRQFAPLGATVKIGEAIAELDPSASSSKAAGGPAAVMPAARAEAARLGVDPGEIAGTGRGGRVLKEDVQRAASSPAVAPSPAPVATMPTAAAPAPPYGRSATERREPMTPLRKRVGERLLLAQRSAAMLTTFNEVDMSAVMRLRKLHGERFQAKHGVKLGFMSFFVRAALDALAGFPLVNARIEGDDIVYPATYDVGIAVGGGKGLVVPVLRSADRLSFAEIEKQISALAERARTNKLTLEELTGGTFTITNGGIYGSMLSTPILNPPQSGILGLHNIVERPVAIGGEVVIRPIMYLALSYDHRLVDGREAVQFLVRVKECVEAPDRLLIEV